MDSDKMLSIYLKSGLGHDVLTESALNIVFIFILASSLLHPASGCSVVAGLQLVSQWCIARLVPLRNLYFLGFTHDCSETQLSEYIVGDSLRRIKAKSLRIEVYIIQLNE